MMVIIKMGSPYTVVRNHKTLTIPSVHQHKEHEPGHSTAIIINIVGTMPTCPPSQNKHIHIKPKPKKSRNHPLPFSLTPSPAPVALNAAPHTAENPPCPRLLRRSRHHSFRSVSRPALPHSKCLNCVVRVSYDFLCGLLPVPPPLLPHRDGRGRRAAASARRQLVTATTLGSALSSRSALRPCSRSTRNPSPCVYAHRGQLHLTEIQQ